MEIWLKGSHNLKKFPQIYAVFTEVVLVIMKILCITRLALWKHHVNLWCFHKAKLVLYSLCKRTRSLYYAFFSKVYICFIPSHPSPKETRLWKLVARPLDIVSVL